MTADGITKHGIRFQDAHCFEKFAAFDGKKLLKMHARLLGTACWIFSVSRSRVRTSRSPIFSSMKLCAANVPRKQA